MNDDKKQLTISLNYRTLVLAMVLLYAITIGVMLYLWQPWGAISSDTRRITVTGESTLEAQPDEFVFSPSYNYESVDKTKALEEASEKTTEIVAELKKLGVEDNDIKVNGYNRDWYWYYDNTAGRVTVSVTAAVNDKDLAQKVQDYLLTTNPQGQITSTPSFSESKRKELQQQGRAEAVADAKLKAQVSATELEVKLGKVISVSEGFGFADYPIAYSAEGEAATLDSTETKRSLPVQPGENKLSYSVTVVFELK